MAKNRLKHSTDVWKQVQGKGLMAPESEVASYRFDHLDFLIAESMLSGCSNIQSIADNLREKPEVIRERLLYPVRCAWISKQLEKGVQSRLGQVIAAVYNRAVHTGDVNAAKFLCQKFEKYREPAQEHKHIHMDLSNLSSSQIDKLINQKKRKMNMTDGNDKKTK